MKVLSLFDGMACGMLAMIASGIKVTRYVAFEVDKYAVQTVKHNFPMVEENGDVFAADFTQYKGFDFLVGGSPCTYWSIAQTKNRETEASGMGWELFNQYVRALKESSPKYFIYENNKSMSQEIKESITKAFGFEPVCIDSALVSAQTRKRLYWVGIRQDNGEYARAVVTPPRDRGILLKDILETGTPALTNEGGESYALTSSFYKEPSIYGECMAHNIKHKKRSMVAEPICVNSKSGRNGVAGMQPSLQDRIYSVGGKMTAITTAFHPNIAEPVRVGDMPNKFGGVSKAQGQRIYSENGKAVPITTGQTKTGFYAIAAPENAKDKIWKVSNGQIEVNGKPYPIKLEDGFYIIRKLSIKESMRLQTVPEWYEFPVSNSQAYKMLGNGWTVEVIAHLIKSAREEKLEEMARAERAYEQLSFLEMII